MRFKRIDVFRLIAIFIVIWAHAQFFDGVKPEGVFASGLELTVVIAMRCTMQFFFIASGYFVGGKIMEEPGATFGLTWKYLKKLLLVFVAWSFIYALQFPSKFMQVVLEDPEKLFFEGARIHLWFLMALFLAILLFKLWPFDKKGYSFLLFGLGLFAVGLLGGSYAVTPIGLNLHFNTRNAIFFSVPFFAIGVRLYVKKPSITPRAAWSIFLFGLILFSVETYILWARWSALPIRHDYLLGSIPYGVGFFLIAYAARKETRLDDILAPYSKYVLGIYASHILFLDLWAPLGEYFDPISWCFLLPILVFVSSLLTVMMISKTPLKWMVL